MPRCTCVCQNRPWDSIFSLSLNTYTSPPPVTTVFFMHTSVKARLVRREFKNSCRVPLGVLSLLLERSTVAVVILYSLDATDALRSVVLLSSGFASRREKSLRSSIWLTRGVWGEGSRRWIVRRGKKESWREWDWPERGVAILILVSVHVTSALTFYLVFLINHGWRVIFLSRALAWFRVLWDNPALKSRLILVIDVNMLDK